VIWILFKLGQVTTALGDYEQAKACYQDCLPMLLEKGDRRMTAITLSSLGHVHHLLAEYEKAQAAFEESLAICQATQNEHEMGFVYGNLGNVRRALGDHEAARRYYRQSVELLERRGENWGLCLNLKRQGILYTEMDEFDAAWGSFRRAMQLAMLQDLPPEMLDILLGIAGILTRQDEPERAAELASLALAHTATAMDARENAMYLLGQIEGRLPEEIFEAARQRGRSMDLRLVAEGVLAELSEQGGDASKHKADDGVAD
jgi:tetratricopeptide (TPR) repeat protein